MNFSPFYYHLLLFSVLCGDTGMINPNRFQQNTFKLLVLSGVSLRKVHKTTTVNIVVRSGMFCFSVFLCVLHTPTQHWKSPFSPEKTSFCLCFSVAHRTARDPVWQVAWDNNKVLSNDMKNPGTQCFVLMISLTDLCDSTCNFCGVVA